MTPTNETQMQSSAAQALLQPCLAAVLRTLHQQNGVVWTGNPGTYDEQALNETAQTVAFTLSGSLQGVLYVSFSLKDSPDLEAAIRQLPEDKAAAANSAAEGTSGTDPGRLAFRFVAALRSPLESRLASIYGTLTLSTPQIVELPTSLRPAGALQLHAAPGSQTVILAALDVTLEAALLQAAHRMGARGAGEDPDLPKPKIERVLDVPLAVTLRFGQRQLTLREVLALSTGSLVELDRQVEEPVDLVLGDRLIARGEVVIVDGNYGLRVTEVMEGASQSLRQLQQVAATAAREVAA